MNTKSWIRTGLKIVLIFELVYLVIFNTVLQVPQTQQLLNQIRPEKFHFRWESAWTFYPFRVHIAGASANGDSRSQSWQVDVESVSASINLLPLIFKQARISNIKATDITYRQRPRLKPEKDFSRVEAFFPPIEGREVSDAINTPRKQGQPWLISLGDIHVSGQHSYWLNQFQGSLAGLIRADMNIQTRGGLLELDLFHLDLDLKKQFVNGDVEMVPGGRLTGSVGFVPFIRQENKGINLLKFLQLDINVNIEANQLNFIDLFLLDFDQFTVDGSGEVKGRVFYDRGFAMPGTGLNIAATDLQVKVIGHTFAGSGLVGLQRGQESNDQLELGFYFTDLSVVHGEDPRAVLKGRDLELKVGGDGYLIPHPDKTNENWSIELVLDGMTVPDMSVFNTYLPPELPLEFTGGEAGLDANFLLKPFDAEGLLELQSQEVYADVGGQSVRADVLASIQLNGGRPKDRLLDVSGSKVVLDNVRVTGEKQAFDDEAWSAVIDLGRADTVITTPPRLDIVAELQASDSRPLVAMFRNRDGWQPKFLVKAMTLEDIKGNIQLKAVENRLVIPEAYVTSDNAEAGMKAVFSGQGNDGVVYMKYKKFDAILKMKNDDRNIDILKARKKYDEYAIKLSNTPVKTPTSRDD